MVNAMFENLDTREEQMSTVSAMCADVQQSRLKKSIVEEKEELFSDSIATKKTKT